MGKDNTKSTVEEGTAGLFGFYGVAEHQCHGILSSFIKRKSRKFAMTHDVENLCKQVEGYKTGCDNLHQALMFMLVENPTTSKQLTVSVKTEPNYRYAAQFLKSYDVIQNRGSEKRMFEKLDPVVKVLSNLDSEHEKRVRKQLENLKPLTKFIGDDYWEYARLRKVYWDSLQSYDESLTIHNKERTEQSEKASATAQTWRNECRQKLIDFINSTIFGQIAKHADSVLKFREECVQYHRTMADVITFGEEAELTKSKSVMK